MSQSDHFSTDAQGTPTAPGRYRRIADIPSVEFVPGLGFRPVLGESMLANFVSFAPHTVAPIHTHVEEQIVIVLEGELEFELDGRSCTALNGGPIFTFSEATSLQIFCSDQEEIDHYWDGLTADGGDESQCGWLKDRFGFSWQVVPTMLNEIQSDDDAKQQAVAEAILSMKKLVIADLQAAYDEAG